MKQVREGGREGEVIRRKEGRGEREAWRNESEEGRGEWEERKKG